MTLLNPLTVRSRGLVIALVPLFLSIGFVVWFSFQLAQAGQVISKSGFAREVYTSTQTLLSDASRYIILIQLDAEKNGFIESEKFTTERLQLKKEARELVNLCKADRSLLKQANRVSDALDNVFDSLKAMELTERNGPQNWSKDGMLSYQNSVRAMENLLLCGGMLHDAKLVGSTDQTVLSIQANVTKLDFAIQIGALLALLLSATMALWFASTIRKPLQLIEDNSLLLSERKSLAFAIKSNDELGSLDQSLHAISEAILSAFHKEEELLQNSIDFVCTLDNDGKILKASPSCFQFVEIYDDALIGRKIDEFIVADEIGTAYNNLHLANADKPHFFDLTLKGASGNLVDSQWSAISDTLCTQIFCAIRENSTAKEIERLRKAFFEMIGSDLQLPLQSLLESVTFLKSEQRVCQSAESMHELYRIERNFSVLIGLVDDLLDFDRFSSGKASISPTKVIVAELVESAVTLVSHLSQDRQIEISCNDPHTALTVDFQKIQRVLVNLLTNAIKYSPASSKIEVAVCCSEKKTRFTVTSFGPCIPEDYRNSIFEPFVQLPREIAGSGLGLGLSICKMLVNAHNGVIGVDVFSAQGKTGNRFWFEL